MGWEIEERDGDRKEVIQKSHQYQLWAWTSLSTMERKQTSWRCSDPFTEPCVSAHLFFWGHDHMMAHLELDYWTIFFFLKNLESQKNLFWLMRLIWGLGVVSALIASTCKYTRSCLVMEKDIQVKGWRVQQICQHSPSMKMNFVLQSQDCRTNTAQWVNRFRQREEHCMNRTHGF